MIIIIIIIIYNRFIRSYKSAVTRLVSKLRDKKKYLYQIDSYKLPNKSCTSYDGHIAESVSVVGVRGMTMCGWVSGANIPKERTPRTLKVKPIFPFETSVNTYYNTGIVIHKSIVHVRSQNYCLR
jgi:hypothetical protein